MQLQRFQDNFRPSLHSASDQGNINVSLPPPPPLCLRCTSWDRSSLIATVNLTPCLAASVCIHSGEQAKSLLQDHVGELEQLLRDADSRLSDTEVRRPPPLWLDAAEVPATMDLHLWLDIALLKTINS